MHTPQKKHPSTTTPSLHTRTEAFEQAYKAPFKKHSAFPFLSTSWRVALEWGAGVGVGFLLGSGCDSCFDTQPWGEVGGLFLGNIAGLLNVYRSHLPSATSMRAH